MGLGWQRGNGVIVARPGVTLRSSFARFEMESMPKKTPQEHSKEKKEGAFPLLGQAGGRKAAAGSLRRDGEPTPGEKTHRGAPKSSALHHILSPRLQNGAPGCEVPDVPGPGRCRRTGIKTPPKIGRSQLLSPRTRPQKKILRLRKEPGEGWCQGGSRGAASAPGVSPGTAASRKCSSNTSPSQILGKGLGLPSLAPTGSTEEAALKGEAQKAGKAPLR